MYCSGHVSLLLIGTTGSTVGTLREAERVLGLRIVLACGASPPTGEKNVSQRLLTKQDLSDNRGRTETTGGSPKVTHPRRTELELQRWGRGPRERHLELRPWDWESAKTHPRSREDCGWASTFWLGVDGDEYTERFQAELMP